MLKALSATWAHIEGAVTTKQSIREKKRLHIRSNTPGFKRHWRLQVIRGGRELPVRIERLIPSNLARLQDASG